MSSGGQRPSNVDQARIKNTVPPAGFLKRISWRLKKRQTTATASAIRRLRIASDDFVQRQIWLLRHQPQQKNPRTLPALN